MGDDNKMKPDKNERMSQRENEIIESKSTFLPEEALDHERRPPEYNMAGEMKKAKKKKDYLYYTVPLLFLIFVLAIAYFLTTYLIQKNQQVDVNITEFENFNLSELLRTANENKNKLDKAKFDLEDLQVERKSQIEGLSEDHKTRQATLKAQGLSKQEENKQMRNLRLEYEKKLQEIKQEYSTKITTKEQELEELEQTVLHQQSVLEKSNMGLSSTGQMDSAQNISEIRLEQQKETYENRIRQTRANYEKRIRSMRSLHQNQVQGLTSKYNPNFTDEFLVAILNEKNPQQWTRPYTTNYRKILSTEKIMSKDQYEQLQKQIADRNLLVKALREVPFTNSVPPTLEKVDYLNNEIFSKQQDMWLGLSLGVMQRDQILGSYEYAFDYYTSLMKESLSGYSGYVVDSRKPEAIVLFLKFVKSVQDGDQVYVVDNDGNYLATLVVRPLADRVLAELLEGNISKVVPFSRVTKNKPTQQQ